MIDGWLRVSLSNTVAFVDAGHEVEPTQFEPGIPLSEQALRHELDILFLQHKLEVKYGMSEWLELGLESPFRATVIDATFLDANGDELRDFESIHHRDEVVAGFADPALKAHFHWLDPVGIKGARAVMSVGVAFPLGHTEEDPFEAGKAGMKHQHMFFGYGTFTPRLGLRWTQPLDYFSVAVWADGILSLYENDKNYKPPSTVVLGTGVQSNFGLDGWWFGLEPRYMIEVPAEWAGERARNSGRHDLLGAAMAGVSLGDQWSLSIDLQTTLASFSQRGNQMTLPAVGILSIFWGAPITGSEPAKH